MILPPYFAAVAVVILNLFLMVSGARAENRITLKVKDAKIAMGSSGWVEILLDNPVDHVAGFQFMLTMNRPDIASFNTSPSGRDTVGTLVSGAEVISVTDPSGVGTSLKFVCLFNDPFVGVTVPPLSPQTGGIAVKLKLNTFPPPFPGDDTLYLIINEQNTSFSDPLGNSIGIVTGYVIDTIGFQCQSWAGDICLSWIRCQPNLNCTDSIDIDTIPYSYLDSNQVALIDGKIAIPVPNCDNNGNFSVNIVDLMCVVNYLFGQFDEQACSTFHCDANGNGTTNIVDLTYFVQYLFQGGPPPVL